MKKENYWLIALIVMVVVGFCIYQVQKISKNVQEVSEKVNRNLDAQFELQKMTFQAKLQEQFALAEQSKKTLNPQQPIERNQIGFKKG
jgi:uncharacterized membrane-anchored protein YhcB (DUF1043 family)